VTATGPVSATAAVYSGLVALVRPKRGLYATGSAGSTILVADATLEESHQDEMEITDHPVEYGTTISDHCFRRPSVVTLLYGFSLSTLNGLLSPLATGALVPGMPSNRLNSIYATLLALQQNRTLFSVYTGRRAYPYVLLKSIALVTDRDTENAMMVKAVCREILFVTTQVTPGLAVSSVSIPALLAAPTNVGGQSLGSGAAFAPGVSHP
jgi:hypothetical protein